MKRALAAAAAIAALLGASTAIAGDSPTGDDDNDYEGRVEKNDNTYFGFDINKSETKATHFAAYLSYKCQNYPNGSGLFEIRDDSLPVDNDKFSGVVETKYRPTVTKRGGPPRSVTVSYDVTGKLGNRGTAEGDIAATAKFKLDDGSNASCKATNDGDWAAKEGRDIDAPLPPFRARLTR